MSTAAALIADLRSAADPERNPNRHYAGAGEVIGVRMGELFAIAKTHTGMPLVEVAELLDQAEYEPRLAAFCILDFRARGRLSDDERRELHDLYLARHDAIDTWDMVDRSAPRVVGGYLRDRRRDVLFELAASPDPLRRRTAITAPLAYTHPAHPDGLADLYRIAEVLLGDADPVVAKPVGIALKHAGAVDPGGVRAFLDRHGDRISAAQRREASAKL